MIRTVEAIRNQAAATLTPQVKEELEQFLTPVTVAQQAANLFTLSKKPVKILDLGAGTGILSALVMRNSPTQSSILAIEKDNRLATLCKESLTKLSPHVTVLNDSLESIQFKESFERVILNPPYKKITPINVSTQFGVVKITNLYTYFFVRAADALTDGGECVAIIPRSWMNGDYFKDFRSWLVAHFSIDTLAIYNSRTDHFKDMNVLQEIMLIKISRGKQQPKITVYPRLTPTKPLTSQSKESYSFTQLLAGHDNALRIQQLDPKLESLPTLEEQGLWVSTGKLVWFRNRDILSTNADETSYPLYWSDNQRGLITLHPVQSKREQWVTREAGERHVVLPAGHYSLVNRFSSKEQEHRIYASYIHSTVDFVVDNKLNYIHQGTSRMTIPLSGSTARGLTLWMSSTLIDTWYRQVSGNTQVNATDLRQMPCPSQKQLEKLANAVKLDPQLSQQTIDEYVERLLK